MAELGQTKDPRELVPGDPEKIEDSAAAIRRLSARFRQVSEDLDRIRISRWSGEASAAFHTAFSPQAAQWRTTSTVFTESAAALESYAQSLRRAQQKAADSITLWQQGEATTQASER